MSIFDDLRGLSSAELFLEATGVAACDTNLAQSYADFVASTSIEHDPAMAREDAARVTEEPLVPLHLLIPPDSIAL
ncbi:hypothetical protein [Methylocystis bryophila]|uniref:Uncharacterized protein n=1 Tax=Methylocystis bryophila TaxID=655015 RepID=A0A1W6MTN2_9HYPH|nr:hypothetical protein [Methylocystis bryophila]ARN80912.1 hypothetical protein B1812_07290 [Methylocystis bryophila]BDV36806.1 hypothetical protein DSM21852_00590 [Methylocystis bryophila]